MHAPRQNSLSRAGGLTLGATADLAAPARSAKLPPADQFTSPKATKRRKARYGPRAAINYTPDAGLGSATFAQGGRRSGVALWRQAIMGTVTAGAMMIGYARRARADCTATAPVTTCTGDFSALGNGITNGGARFTTGSGVTTVNVNGLTANIAPTLNTNGIYLRNDTAAGATVNFIPNTAFDTITATGGGEGIRVRSSVKGIVDSDGDINVATGDAIQVKSDTITIDSSGKITTNGNNSAGIYAISSTNNATIVVTTSGDITANGNNAKGIYVYDKYYSANVTVNVTGGTVQGGATGTGAAAIYLYTESYNVAGSGLFTVNVSAGATVKAGSAATDAIQFEYDYYYSQVIVNNSGTVTGSVYMERSPAGSLHQFNNKPGGVFNSGAKVEFETGRGTLTNEGNLSPGGVGAVQTTAFTGTLTQLAAGTTTVDINQAAGTNDLVTVTGTANLAGTITPNIIDLTATGEVKILTATGGIVNNGLTAVDVGGVDFGVELRNGNTELFLTFVVAPQTVAGTLAGGGTAEQQRLARQLDAIIAAGGGAQIQALVNALLALPNGQALVDALNRLLLNAQQSGSVQASQSFGNSLLSCAVREGAFVVTKEGECYWAKAIVRDLKRDVTNTHSGVDGSALSIAGGVQVALRDEWRLGFGMAYEESRSKTRDRVQRLGSSEGYRVHAGVVLKNQLGPVNISASLLGDYGRFDTTRNINLPGVGLTARGEQSVYNGTGRLRLSRLMQRGRVYVKPLVDLSAQYIHLDGFTETGAAGANLRVSDASKWLLSASPAIEIGTEIMAQNGIIYRPYLKGGFTKISKNSIAIPVNFATAPAGLAPFTFSSSFDDLFADVAAGMTVVFNNENFLKLQYEGHFADDTTLHAGTIKFGVKF